MSYSGLGGISISEAIKIGSKVINDPYLPEFACEAQRFSNVDKGKPSGGTCPRVTASPTQIGRGIGLRHFTGPLRLYTWHKQHPWVAPVALAAVFGFTYYIGHRAGKRKR